MNKYIKQISINLLLFSYQILKIEYYSRYIEMNLNNI